MMTLMRYCTFFIGVFLAASNAMAAPLQEGDTAPDFKLQASDGNTYSLADYRGKKAVAVAFFPKAFTGGWSLQVQSLRDSEAELAKYNVAYFMASVDTVKDNKKFAKQQKANFPLLCDSTKQVTKLYGAQVQYGDALYAQRWTIYIDKNGVIKKIDKQVNPRSAGPDMLKAFSQLGFDRVAS